MDFEEFLKREKEQEYFDALMNFVAQEREQFIVYPLSEEVFSAFELTPFDKTRVVIIGQDPYHNPKQANGLAFSVREGLKLPSSLRNIFKELEADVGIHNTNGSLVKWAQQGVLLLNTTLTVRQNEPLSHRNKGWEIFTRKWIVNLNTYKEGLVFVLWGRHAQQFEPIINSEKHIILKSVHPSGLSASRGFFGSKVFSQINQIMSIPIDWSTD